MENTKNYLKRKERDELSLENIFRQIKLSWPHINNIKIYKAMKTILELGLQQSIFGEHHYQGLKSVAKLLIDQSNISEVNELLEFAIDKDETDAVKVVLKHGIEINAKLPKSQMTPIQLSSAKGLSQITKFLIKNGAYVDTQDINRLTLLQQAIINKDIELIELLINHGANVHTKGRNERPLILALENGLLEVAELLIKNDANINTQSSWNATPLQICSEKGYLKIAKILIEKGAILNSADVVGVTPLQEAVQHTNREIFHLLMKKKVNPNPETTDGFTPLHSAAGKGEIEVARILLKAGAMTEKRNEYGMFPIHLAVFSKKAEMVELLIKFKANINQIVVPFSSNSSSTFLHDTPLNWAVREGLEEIVKVLIDNGADLEIPDNQKLTPLLKAIMWKKNRICKLLISSGANVHATYGNPGQHATPLHLSVYKENEEISKTLILNGASVNAKLIYTCDSSTPLYYAITKRNVEICRMLICAGADVNVKDSQGLSLIHFAVHFGRNASKHLEVLNTRQIIQLLIKSGACSNQQNNYGQSPEEITLSQNKLEMVKFINWCKSQV